jgi:RNA polymerase sigma factor (sigma-70 family)
VNPVRADSPAASLVTRARNGEKQAWDELVEQYAPLIWSICRRYRLPRSDAEDVGQSVWLALIGHLAALRDPAALPGWLATTTQRECGRVLRAVRRPEAPRPASDAGDVADQQAPLPDQELLRAEYHATLREAFTQLPPRCQQLLAMLIQDPPVPYAQISAKLGIAVGSIGPTRARCLDKLRQHPAIAALINAEAASTGTDVRRQPAMAGC